MRRAFCCAKFVISLAAVISAIKINEEIRKPVIHDFRKQGFHVVRVNYPTVSNRGVHTLAGNQASKSRTKKIKNDHKTCPEFCSCFEENSDYFVSCSNVNRTTFPWAVHRNVTGLFLPNCHLRLLIPNMFHKLYKLESLHITRCRTKRITELALTNLTSLLSADFSGNEFEEINDDRGLDSAITDHSAVFRPVALNYSVFLKTVNLAHNKIKDPIQSKAFKSFKFLRVFNLSHNNLNKVGSAFSKLMALHTLDLSHNFISYVEDDALESNVVLKELYLSHNTLKSIKHKVWRHLFELKVLDLSSNKISTVEHESFASLIAVRELYLQNNSIYRLQQKLFACNSLLTQLDLSSNVIATIAPNSFVELHQLTSLLLNSNRLSSVEPYTFAGLVRLNILVLSDNRIRNISPQAFCELTSLKYLKLKNNNLQELSPSVFDAMHFIHSISLNGNFLTQVQTRWFLVPALRIESRKIVEEYPGMSIPFSVLTALSYKNSVDHFADYDLSDNPWDCSCQTRDFLTWFHFQKTIRVRNFRSLRCHDPLYHRGYILTELSPEQLSCWPISLFQMQILAVVIFLVALCSRAFWSRQTFMQGRKTHVL